MTDYSDHAAEADYAYDADMVDGHHGGELIARIEALEARIAELEGTDD